MQALRNEFIEEIVAIKEGAASGRDMTDDLCDEIGDYYEAVNSSNDPALLAAFNTVQSGVDATCEEQATLAQQALELLA